jgi:nucleoside-diphosphate-sugar epimerase
VLTKLGVDGIFHTASPIDFSITTFEEMVTPAVRGAETILASALKAGPQLTSVVVTSSTIAVVNPVEGEYVFTENDYATFALDKALKDKEAGEKSPSSILYGASKTASDRAVWKFRDEHKVRPLTQAREPLLTEDSQNSPSQQSTPQL